MTEIKILVVVVVVIIFGAAAALWTMCTRIEDEKRQRMTLQDRLDAYRKMNMTPLAFYRFGRVETSDSGYAEYNGLWGVYRVAIMGGEVFKTTLKVFTDEDDDFNRREAEELCDILNGK